MKYIYEQPPLSIWDFQQKSSRSSPDELLMVTFKDGSRLYLRAGYGRYRVVKKFMPRNLQKMLKYDFVKNLWVLPDWPRDELAMNGYVGHQLRLKVTSYELTKAYGTTLSPAIGIDAVLRADATPSPSIGICIKRDLLR